MISLKPGLVGWEESGLGHRQVLSDVVQTPTCHCHDSEVMLLM